MEAYFLDWITPCCRVLSPCKYLLRAWSCFSDRSHSLSVPCRHLVPSQSSPRDCYSEPLHDLGSGRRVIGGLHSIFVFLARCTATMGSGGCKKGPSSSFFFLVLRSGVSRQHRAGGKENDWRQFPRYIFPRAACCIVSLCIWGYVSSAELPVLGLGMSSQPVPSRASLNGGVCGCWCEPVYGGHGWPKMRTADGSHDAQRRGCGW
ncbi:hypothetical protein B0I37DRAFT_83483 [Chaetomium sp. MPI-CAGE-AT-0009]|nr:hypothetical protein B0I37DRAFT_83483 [Chaetomium sp. MPI-CAGE-AT-0009]